MAIPQLAVCVESGHDHFHYTCIVQQITGSGYVCWVCRFSSYIFCALLRLVFETMDGYLRSNLIFYLIWKSKTGHCAKRQCIKSRPQAAGNSQRCLTFHNSMRKLPTHTQMEISRLAICLTLCQSRPMILSTSSSLCRNTQNSSFPAPLNNRVTAVQENPQTSLLVRPSQLCLFS